MKKRKILLISAIPPFPKNSGGATRIINTIKELSKYYELFLIYFKNEDTCLIKDEIKFINSYCKKSYSINMKSNINFSYYNVGQPYWFSPWYSTDLIFLVNKIIEESKIDVVQVECSQLLYLINYISKKNSLQSIFTAYDISTISFLRRLKEVRDYKIKLVHYLRFLEIFFYERNNIPKYNQINSVSINDKNSIKKMFNVNHVVNVPNGIEKVKFLKPNTKKNIINLGYIGSFSHSPNITGVTYFLNEIAPLLEKKRINYQYFLAGENSIEEINYYLKDVPQYIKNKVKILGFVKNSEDFYQQIDILIAPIFSGSGSRIKILEAISFGKLVISSPIGAEGVSIKTNFILIAHNPKEYIDHILDFTYNQASINYKAEKIKIKQFTWQNIFKKYSNAEK